MATIKHIGINPNNTTERTYTTDKGTFTARPYTSVYHIFNEQGDHIATAYDPLTYIKNNL